METRRESTPQWKTTIIVSTALKVIHISGFKNKNKNYICGGSLNKLASMKQG